MSHPEKNTMTLQTHCVPTPNKPETDTNEFICLNCGIVYDVVYEGEQIWHVTNTDFKLVIDVGGEVRPPNFTNANQTQASVFPLCVKIECVISKTQGILSDEPIAVRLK